MGSEMCIRDSINGNSNTFEEQLQAGKLDLYIGVDVGENANRERIELTREKVQCCFSEELLREYYPEEWERILEDFRKGADLRQILRLPFITVCQGNRLRKGIDAFFSTCSLPQYVFECDEQGLVYELARKGNGAGLLSPVICWKNYHEEKNQGNRFMYSRSSMKYRKTRFPWCTGRMLRSLDT